MTAQAMKHFESWTRWSVGVHMFSQRYGTVVVLLGTAWNWDFKSGKGQYSDNYCFGLTLGPLTVGGSLGRWAGSV